MPASTNAADAADKFDFETEGAPELTWGDLTHEQIAAGFDQGGHAADPSGDGLGPEDRVGLANVVEPGDIFATAELIDSLLP